MTEPVIIGNATLYCGDCLQILPTLAKGSVDCVVTDPPYPREFYDVWHALGRPSFDACRDGAFLATLCGQCQVPHVIDCILNGGWSWYWLSIASNNNQPIMHGFKVKCCYKPMVLVRKGDAIPRRYWFDDISLRAETRDWKRAQGDHKWGQAESLFFEPIEAFTDEGECVCDPFMGSGSVGIAALHMQRRFLGIEVDPRHFATACRRIREESERYALLDPLPPAKAEPGLFGEPL